jgi:hypothetical protein
MVRTIIKTHGLQLVLCTYEISLILDKSKLYGFIIGGVLLSINISR